MGFDDISNQELRLGLCLGLGLSLRDESPENCMKRQKKKNELDPCNNNNKKAYPSLTLGSEQPSKTEWDEYCFHAGASSPSAVSSFSNSSSIKRERDQDFDPSSRVVDVDENGNHRKKLRLTKEQSAVLEDSFREHSTLNPKQKQELAKELNLRARQVEVWFQNRRARTKLKQTEVDCEVLKKCCESLTEENKRLQKELQELKSMKTTTPPGPLYVQLPVTSLTICPCCERIISGGGGSNNTNNNNNNNNNINGHSYPNTALLIGSKVHDPLPHHFYKTNYPFTQSSAAY